jgi:hypothetical protein
MFFYNTLSTTPLFVNLEAFNLYISILTGVDESVMFNAITSGEFGIPYDLIGRFYSTSKMRYGYFELKEVDNSTANLRKEAKSLYAIISEHISELEKVPNIKAKKVGASE